MQKGADTAMNVVAELAKPPSQWGTHVLTGPLPAVLLQVQPCPLYSSSSPPDIEGSQASGEVASACAHRTGS